MPPPIGVLVERKGQIVGMVLGTKYGEWAEQHTVNVYYFRHQVSAWWYADDFVKINDFIYDLTGPD